MPPVSQVWKFFSKPFNSPNGLVVKCKDCGKELKYKNTTSNLRNHYEARHKEAIPSLAPKGGKKSRSVEPAADAELDTDDPSEEVPVPKVPRQSSDVRSTSSTSSASSQPTSSCDPSGSRKSYQGPLDRCFGNINSFAVGSHRDTECTNALIYMIAVDNMPLRAPDKKGLRKFVQTLQPLHKMPYEPESTRLLEAKYEVLRSRVKLWLSEATTITLTTDLWTHKNTMRGYLGVTAHFRRDRKEISVELCARPMPQRKTIINLKEVLSDVCVDWSIDFANVKAVVSDGGANIKGAVKQLFGAEKHITCVAHLFNLIVQKVIGNGHVAQSEDQVSVVQDDEDDFHEENEENEAAHSSLRNVILKLKRVVRYFRQSEVATGKLLSTQQSDGNRPESECLRLIQEVRTRFNSCHDMIDRYLAIASHVSRVLGEMHRDRASKAKPPALLTTEGEDALIEVRDVLAPLARATREVSGGACTLSKVIPVLRNLKADINKTDCNTVVGRDLKTCLLKLLHEKFGNVEDVRMFAAATLLDPRFKKVGFSKDEKSPIRISNAISFVGDLVKSKIYSFNERTNEVAMGQTPMTAPADDFWGDFDQEVQNNSATACHQDMGGGFPVQLRSYLDQPCVSRTAFPDPMDAWELYKNQYCHVYSVAAEYLSIVATSIPAERLFSHAGNIATPGRSRITARHLDMRVFLQSCADELWI